MVCPITKFLTIMSAFYWLSTKLICEILPKDVNKTFHLTTQVRCWYAFSESVMLRLHNLLPLHAHSCIHFFFPYVNERRVNLQIWIQSNTLPTPRHCRRENQPCTHQLQRFASQLAQHLKLDCEYLGTAEIYFFKPSQIVQEIGHKGSNSQRD